MLRAMRGVLTGLSPQAIPPHAAPALGSSHEPPMMLLHSRGSMWGTKEPFSRSWTLGRATVSAQGYNVSGLSWTPCCQASATKASDRAAPAAPPRGWLKWSPSSAAPRTESGHYTAAGPRHHHPIIKTPFAHAPSGLRAPARMATLTTPARDLPFTMSTNWTAISSPQRLWASWVLAPRWGQLMTFSWSTKARSRGGSCPEETPLGWRPWAGPA